MESVQENRCEIDILLIKNITGLFRCAHLVMLSPNMIINIENFQFHPLRMPEIIKFAIFSSVMLFQVSQVEKKEPSKAQYTCELPPGYKKVFAYS